MKKQTFERSIDLPVESTDLYDWHVRPGAFERLSPPWEDVRMTTPPARIVPGDKQGISVRLGPVHKRWVSKITEVDEGKSFRDVQLEGPFAFWEHAHLMQPAGPKKSTLVDRVVYALPLGAAGRVAAGGSVRAKLERMFAYRHRVTKSDLSRHAAVADAEPLDVLITGSSGMVGRALTAFLTTGGHRVRQLVRREPKGPDEFRWDPDQGEIDVRAFEGTDAVVHLAGENIAGGRWTPQQKDRIRRSRVAGTGLIADAIRATVKQPKTFISASAVGWYGSRGDELLDEESTPGSDFLAGVCEAWEKQAASVAHVRAVQLRFGVILSPAGGALKKMLLPFLMGGGGPLGTGKQWMSWIALDDVLGAIHHAIITPDLEGPVNTISPNPVTNADYTRTLASVLRRPAIVPMPGFAARLAFGELADALLLGGQRVQPKRLEESGFEFHYADLESALRHVLGRSSSARSAHSAPSNAPVGERTAAQGAPGPPSTESPASVQ